jgi:hypothetical protein
MKKNYLLVILFLVTESSCNCQISIYDDFEGPGLSRIWTTGRMELRSFEIRPEIVRKGKNAAKITLRTGDIVEAGNDSSLNSERDELEEAEYLNAVQNKTYEYQFSLFLPDSFPIVSTRLIIAQWMQRCSQTICSDNSPIFAVRYQSGKLMITLNTDSGRHKLYELKDEIRNRWLDFKFQIRFAEDNGGEIIGFLNDKLIINYGGITSYTPKKGYDAKNNRYYFKIGLYRDRMLEPMFIYIDEYRKKEIQNK